MNTMSSHAMAAPSGAGPEGVEDLLAEMGAGPADRVLIIGAADAGLLCGALRRGCRSAAGVRGVPACPEPADLVLAPRIRSEAEAEGVLRCAFRALQPAGAARRLAICLAGHEGWTAARRLVASARRLGFGRIRLRARAGGGLLLVCRLPPLRLV